MDQAADCMHAVQILPDCVLLHFACADLEEQRGEVQAASEVYERLALRMLPPEQTTPDSKSQVRRTARGLAPHWHHWQ